MVRPGDLVKHADWKESPINSYRDGVGLVVRYDKNLNPNNPVSEEILKNWVQVQWLPYDPSTCNTVYHVDSLIKYENVVDTLQGS